MNFKSTFTVALAASASLLTLATGAHAVAPTTLTSIPAGDVLITELTSPYSVAATGQSTFGTIYSAVYSNTSGGLDFFYQFNVSAATSPVSQFTASDFTVFNTNLYQLNQVDIDGSGPFTSTGVAATDGFVTSGTAYFTFGTTVNAGSQSNTLLVTTNAKLYTQNNGTITAGAAANAPVLAPTLAPEASSLALLIPGAFGLIGLIRYRKAAK